MARQYFPEVISDPNVINLAAVSATVETGLWNVPAYTPIHAFDAYRGAGKLYKITAGGIFSTPASASTLILTPRIGTTTGGISLGPSQAQNVPVSLTNAPWRFEFDLVVRTVGLPGASSTCIGTGFFTAPGSTGNAGSATLITCGGSSTTADLSVETGFFLGWTMNNSGSNTPHYAYIMSMN